MTAEQDAEKKKISRWSQKEEQKKKKRKEKTKNERK